MFVFVCVFACVCVRVPDGAVRYILGTGASLEPPFVGFKGKPKRSSDRHFSEAGFFRGRELPGTTCLTLKTDSGRHRCPAALGRNVKNQNRVR